MEVEGRVDVDGGAAGPARRSLGEVFCDETLMLLCLFLPATTLLHTGGTSQALREGIRDCPMLWRLLCEGLLGTTLIKFHQAAQLAAGKSQAELEHAVFYRNLFRKAFLCPALRYAAPLRKACVKSLAPPAAEGAAAEDSEAQAEQAEALKATLRKNLCASGHTACAMEHLVVIAGGWRNARTEQEIHLCVVDVSAPGGPQMREPRLTADSARPERRLRHSACVVRPELAGDLEVFKGQAVLVLGGCNDRSRDPCPGLQCLNMLQFTKPDGSEARWHMLEATGDAPRAIWHHICGSFKNGKRVVVFGGDFEETDEEYTHIQNRLQASVVYVLDVDARRWDRVQTSGRRPSWRSLHAGVTYASLADSSERLVILGGCETHTEIFSGGQAVSMRGYALDLSSYTWLVGPDAADGGKVIPTARMRFAAERFGRFLLIYGGHGREEVEDHESLLKLNLLTLAWDQVEVRNRPHSYPNIPAATLAGGVIAGGVQFTVLGVRPVPKLDFLILDDTPAERRGAAEGTETEDASAADGGSNGDDDDDDSEEESETPVVRVRMHDENGVMQAVQLDQRLLTMLLRAGAIRVRSSAAADDDDNDDNDDE